MPQLYYQTPVGTARITDTGGFISSVSILDDVPEMEQQSSEVIELAVKQLDEYFAGTRTIFDFPMKQEGSAFQQQVWDTLLKIDYAKTISYKQQSQMMNNPLAIRAIAAANGQNHLWLVVPCHRVIGADGSLTGYGGGLWRKKWLLAHEAKVAGVGQTALNF
ncbi:methylated-DNA--[protein]-cysteine S-methyltransferase [Mucilaginibacter sp. AW1-3]